MNTTFVYIVFANSVALTGWHLLEEHRGKLWRYFGAIAGVEIADGVGTLFFTVILGATLVGVAVLGILDFGGQFTGFAPVVSLAGVGFLIGARISDWWISHANNLRMGYRGNRGYHGNPGLLSSWFYWVDVTLLIALLFYSQEVWNTAPGWGPVLGLLGGVVLGGGLFFLVIGAIRWIGGKWFPQSLRTPWEKNDPMPAWAG